MLINVFANACVLFQVNLTQEEIATKYDNQLTPEVTMAMSSLIAKIFKVLSQSKVRDQQHYICITVDAQYY